MFWMVKFDPIDRLTDPLITMFYIKETIWVEGLPIPVTKSKQKYVNWNPRTNILGLSYQFDDLNHVKMIVIE